jgi:hypothetical protein
MQAGVVARRGGEGMDEVAAQRDVDVEFAPVDDVPRRASRLVRRQRVFLAITSAAALLSVVGLLASTLVKSPAEQAASQGPPPASVLTAPVVSRVLSQTVVVRGTVTAGRSVTATPGAIQGAAALVVTARPKQPGDPVKPGDVLVQVSGRPIIALPGTTPVYRDLKPGDTGDDIAGLQDALRSLGYTDADRHGYFGAGTKKAVAALYGKLGYDAPTTGGPDDAGDRAALQEAAQAVTAAQRGLDRARSALAAARSVSPRVPATVAAAEQAVHYAEQDLATAKSQQANLVGSTGVDVPMSEVLFVPSFPAFLVAISTQVGSAVTAPLVTLDAGHLVVTSVLQQSDAALLKTGMPVQIVSEILNQTAEGTVSRVGSYSAGSQSTAGTSNDSTNPTVPSGYPLTVTPDTGLDSAWRGEDVRLTVTAASTPGPVLVVPVAAVTTRVDGTTSVTVVRQGNRRYEIAVTPGVDASGFVEVDPVTPGALKAGDVVVTGT